MMSTFFEAWTVLFEQARVFFFLKTVWKRLPELKEHILVLEKIPPPKF